MNYQTLISAIRSNNDLRSISIEVGIPLTNLKDRLINMIRQSSGYNDAYDSDVTVMPDSPSEDFPSDTPITEDLSTDSDSQLSEDMGTVYPETNNVENIEMLDSEFSIESSDEEGEEDTEEERNKRVYEKIIRNAPVAFSHEQLSFLNFAVKDRKDLLLAAPAGFGKSAVISTTVALFRELVKPFPVELFYSVYGNHHTVADLPSCSVVGLCASTGKAASLIGGRTLHSYLGIGMGRGTPDDWYSRVSSAKYLADTLANLRAVQVIIIDEISMISASMFDKISEYLQKIRRNTKPFGGIQMICVGDFCQLSPVEGEFVYKSNEFIANNFQIHKLTKCFRQSDPVFLKMLGELRFGECSEQTLNILRARTSIDEAYSEGLKPMRLLSTNAEVDRINERELNRVCQDTQILPTVFPVEVMSGQQKKADACRKMDSIPESVKLVVGAQVVVTHNLGLSVVNGSQGLVVSMSPKEVVVSIVGGAVATIKYIPYKSPDDPNIYDATTLFNYLPLRLGWASTIHKSQGMSLTLLEVDLTRVFSHGQGYVAISRVRDLRGLCVKGLSKRSFICSNEVKKFYGV